MLDTTAYTIYLVVSVFVTAYVSTALSRYGLAILTERYEGRIELARSTNHLFTVGFYLISLGFVLLRMHANVNITDFEHLFVYEVKGLGLVMLVLGLAHFLYMYVIHRISRNALR
jgi:hypothetical protein